VIKRLVVVFIPLHLILRSIVERHWDHVRLLDDLPDGTSLPQKIVASLVLPITKFLPLKITSFTTPFSMSPSGQKVC
jgi:inner membrane protein involved in colicin E2 resistance